jgi:hypothetical protein
LMRAAWTPERRAKQAEVARATTSAYPYRPPNAEGRARITAGIKLWHRRRLGWIPDELRPEYTRLVRNIGAADAKARIEALIADREAAMTPFERQLAKVRAGAGIIELRPLRTAAPDRSLVGCGTAMAAFG